MKKNISNVTTDFLTNLYQYLLQVDRISRKTSSDESTNLLNIVKGEIVFVCLRPALYNQNDLMDFRVATSVSKLKPCITSWAQINGRDEISIAQKVQLEQECLYKRFFI